MKNISIKKLLISLCLCIIVRIFLISINQLNDLSFIAGVITFALFCMILERSEAK